MSPDLQTLVVAAIGLACAWQALRRVAPRAAWQCQARLSFALERPGRPSWARRLGQNLRPREMVAGSGCGSGCSSCGGCAAPPARS